MVPNGLCTIGTMIGRSHITIREPLVFVIFSNHIGINYRCQVILGTGPYHIAFPICIVSRIITKPDCQMGKALPRQVNAFKFTFPLPPIIEMTFVKGGERKRRQKRQRQSKSFLHNNTRVFPMYICIKNNFKTLFFLVKKCKSP